MRPHGDSRDPALNRWSKPLGNQIKGSFKRSVPRTLFQWAYNNDNTPSHQKRNMPPPLPKQRHSPTLPDPKARHSEVGVGRRHAVYVRAERGTPERELRVSLKIITSGLCRWHATREGPSLLRDNFRNTLIGLRGALGVGGRGKWNR